MDLQLVRQLWQALEPYHAVTYFTPDTRQATDAIGLKGGWMSYFACRAAPLGPVAPEVVTAVFYGFAPQMVRRALPDAWSYAPLEAVLAARLEAVDRALRRLLGDTADSVDVREAADLAAEAAAAADCLGRPLAAANQALPIPEEPHLRLWQASTVLREHRGEGHSAALLVLGIDPVAAHLLIVGAGNAEERTLQAARRWPAEVWAQRQRELIEEGALDDRGLLTERGRELRSELEDTTDRLARQPWTVLGVERARRLRDLVIPLSRRILVEGNVPMPNPIGLTWPPEWSNS